MDKITTAELKTKGLLTLLKTDNSVAKSTAVFNSQTGERLADEVIQIFPDQLLQEKETLQARIDEIDSLLAEIEATPITPPVKETLSADTLITK